MPGDDKRLLDYFIKHTNKRFTELKEEMGTQHRGLSRQIRQLKKFGFVIALLCVALSPKGEKILNYIPKLLPMASALAGGR